MALPDPKAPTRAQLAKFIPDQDALRLFERLFQQGGMLLPDQIETLFRLTQEALIDAGSAQSSANLAHAQLKCITDALELLAMAPAPQAIDGLRAAVSELATLASRPDFILPRGIPLDYLEFNENPAYAGLVRQVAWDAADDTLNIHHSDGVTQQVGQELYGRITNNTGSLIPNGAVVGINPASNSYVLFIANGTLPSVNVVGVATQDIPVGQQGRITVWGQVHDLNTTGAPYGEVWVAGDVLYVSPTVAGGYTKVKPTAPNQSIPVAWVRSINATTGFIGVRASVDQQLYYGQFIKTADQVPTAVNTANAITWDATTIASGVSIGVPSSRIVVANSGLYKFSAAFQLTSSSAAVKNVWLWFRKNGVDVASSAIVTSMDSATAIRTPSRSQFFSLAAGDYIEMYWASDSTAVTLDNIPSTAFAPATPAAQLSVTQEQQ